MNLKPLSLSLLLASLNSYADTVLQIDNSWDKSKNVAGYNEVTVYNSIQSFSITNAGDYNIGPSSPGSFFAHIQPASMSSVISSFIYDASGNTVIDTSGNLLSSGILYNSNNYSLEANFTDASGNYVIKDASGNTTYVNNGFVNNIGSLAQAMGNVSASEIQTHLQPTAVNTDDFYNPTNFAYFSNTLNLNPGVTYKFYWSIANSDYSPFTDGAFMALSQGTSIIDFNILARLGRCGNIDSSGNNCSSISNPGDPGFQNSTKILASYGATQWQAKTFSVASAGSYKLTFGAFNAADNALSPSFFISDLEGTVEAIGASIINRFYPTPQDTNTSLQLAAYQLRSAYNSQLAASNLSLTHDCNLFDTKGLCISAGGRYTTIDNPSTNASAAVVTLGYKVNPNIRVGGFLDQNVNIHTSSSINIANKNPLMGLYAVWNKDASGLGYQLRVANTYQDKDITTTRVAYGDTGEAGSGTSKLNSQSYLAELSYAFQYQDKTLVRPYFGLRYTKLKRDGYIESSGAEFALTYDALNDHSTTSLMGARVNYQATAKTTLTANIGIEQDLHHKVDSLTATNTDIGELNAVAFNSSIKRSRPVASVGVSYDVTKAQRLSGTVAYQQLPFQSTGASSLFVNYMIGF